MIRSGVLVYVDLDGTLTRTNAFQHVLALRRMLARQQPCGKHHLAYLATIGWMPWLSCLLGLGAAAMRDRGTYRLYRGIRVETLAALCQDYWRAIFPRRHHASVVARLRALAARGHDVVVISGSIEPIVQAFVDQAGLAGCVTAIIGARLAADADGVLTGQLLGPPMVASQKVAAAIAWEAARPAAYRERICISDSSSDLPLLEYGQQAIVVAPGRRLRRLAMARGWEVWDPG